MLKYREKNSESTTKCGWLLNIDGLTLLFTTRVFNIFRTFASVVCSRYHGTKRYLLLCKIHLCNCSRAPIPTRVGKKKRVKGPDTANKLPTVTPYTKCRLRLLKMERIKDYLLMEEEYIKNQERMKVSCRTHTWGAHSKFSQWTTRTRRKGQKSTISEGHQWRWVRWRRLSTKTTPSSPRRSAPNITCRYFRLSTR